jgi:hypothetical protein
MTIDRKLVRRVVIAFAVLAVVVTAVANATHVRPKGATPIKASLVPAFKQCTAPNRTHGAPLAFPSCAPPVPESNSVTVGTPDSNGAPANSIGFVQISVGPPSFNGELKFHASVSDVRCRPGTAASVCGSPNAQDGPDYSGDLQVNGTVRISDHYNGPNLDEAATVQDIPNPIHMICANTADTSTGGVCNDTVATTCPLPEGCSIAGRRTVIEFDQIRVEDGGPDGNVFSTPNTTFMRQGVFIP